MSREKTIRTRAWLSQLGAADDAVLEQALAPGRVTILLSTADAHRGQAQLIVSMLTNLLIRGSPVVQQLSVVLTGDPDLTATVPRWRAKTLRRHLSGLIESVRPDVNCRFTDTLSATDVLVQVGQTEGNADRPPREVFVGSEGWTVHLSASGPVPIGDNPNPVGAYAAACMAAGEVWKVLLVEFDARQRFPIHPLTSDLTFSTYSLAVESRPENPGWPPVIDVGSLNCVGLGAGGGATLFTLASTEALRGSISLVDPDEIDHSNLNRYVFADDRDASLNRSKTDVLKRLLKAFPEVRIELFSVPFGEANLSDYEFVAAAVHSREARRDIQYETPNVMWDAGATEDGEFRVWRLQFGYTECMWCKHPPGAHDPETESARQLSETLGLSPEEWLVKLKTNGPFSIDEISRIQRRPDALWHLPEDGERFGGWFAGQCGRLQLEGFGEEIPMPFAPVMAGILVAGEIVKEHYFPADVLDSYYWNTLMGRFMRRNKPQHRGPSKNCQLCGDPDFLEQHRRRWRSDARR